MKISTQARKWLLLGAPSLLVVSAVFAGTWSFVSQPSSAVTLTQSPVMAEPLTPAAPTKRVPIAGGVPGGENPWYPSPPWSPAPPAGPGGGGPPERWEPDPNYLVVTSDPQYPWGPGPDVEGNSRKFIAEQYASINQFAEGKNVLGTFINGDLTAYGHAWQVDYMKGALKTLKQPVYLGLGNHDYEGNSCWENECARRSVWWFADHMSKMPLDAFDIRFRKSFQFQWPFNGHNETYGSLGWSKSFGSVQVIQLNNYPEYATSISNFQWSSWTKEVITIKSSIPWLDRQMSLARRQGKAIILMMHKPQGGPEFQALIDRYEVTAIMAGHHHADAGKETVMGATRVPVYLSGSADYKTYLTLKWTPGHDELSVFLVRNNNWVSQKLIERIKLKTPIRDLAPKGYPFTVTVRNNGGYDAGYWLTYDVKGRQHTQDRHLHFLQAHTFNVPDGATNVRVQSSAYTGILWDKWNPIFNVGALVDDACMINWGTTWHPGWGHCD